MTTTYPRSTTRQAPRRSAARQAAPLRRLSVDIPRSSAAYVGHAIAIICVMIGGMVMSLLATTYAGHLALESQDLRVEVSQAVAARQRLESDVARAESPENLLTVARKMGMVPAANPVFLRLSDHVIIGRQIPARSNGS